MNWIHSCSICNDECSGNLKILISQHGECLDRYASYLPHTWFRVMNIDTILAAQPLFNIGFQIMTQNFNLGEMKALSHELFTAMEDYKELVWIQRTHLYPMTSRDKVENLLFLGDAMCESKFFFYALLCF